MPNENVPRPDYTMGKQPKPYAGFSQPIPAAPSEAPEHLCDELRWIDERLSRRPALEGLTTRAAKIERMCSVASRAEKAEAEKLEGK